MFLFFQIKKLFLKIMFVLARFFCGCLILYLSIFYIFLIFEDICIYVMREENREPKSV